MSAQPATRRRLEPLEHEALLLRHQSAMELLKHPDLHALPDLDRDQRCSLLAAVVWPPAELLEWSLERARSKLEGRL